MREGVREQNKAEIVFLCEVLVKTVRQETFDLIEEQVEPHTWFM